MIPKVIKSIKLQFITPCYCRGANPPESELRAPTFRGELRWWFRCLGGSWEQEKKVFGGVREPALSSAVILRVGNVVRATAGSGFSFEKPVKANNSSHAKTHGDGENDKKVNSAYITYFITPPEKKHLEPKSRFSLELLLVRELGKQERDLLDLAWDCMCNLGAVGARKTRALGAFAPVEESEQKVRELINHPCVKKYFEFRLIDKKQYAHDNVAEETRRLLSDCANMLNQYRRKNNLKSTICSALGYAAGKARQSSAIRFRPVMIENKVYLCVLKAPDITLGREAKKHNIETL